MHESPLLAHLQRQYQHETWATATLMTACLQHPDDPRLRVLTSHLVNAGERWHHRIDPENAPTPDGIWDERPITDNIARHAAWAPRFAQWMAEEGEHGLLTGTVPYTNSQGQTFSSTYLDVVTQLLLHASYHRGQIAANLRALGTPAPNTDYIFWARA